jgi:hypothetical protein
MDQTQNVGYDSFILIKNLNTLGLTIAFYFLQIIVYSIVNIIMKSRGKKSKFMTKWGQSLFFSQLLLVLIEGSFEFPIASILQLYEEEAKYFIFVPFSYLFLSLYLVFLPLLYIWAAFTDVSKLKNKNFV